ncbi:armadillo-type protein [Dendryphion nanum]|uniref:Armadillo-type protein n=1 Tax=Dendryphion nanum TaxID=256645 RepID=A0A9P9DA45_9PLEO|nr:armadillo-type protein [Dendryphion nanum]
MAAMSRGPVPKLKPVKKIKGGTPSSRKHHFESFTVRIAKLKIEPVRRGRSTIVDDAELDATFSYFKNALDEWRDINMGEGFTTFARAVAPLCESLPQLLHHGDRVLDLLVEYIEKGDTFSEEPLLSLVAHFAHDLGVKFEKHFERAVKAVAHLAATHQAVEVIEWSFSCLAWLFKYLSRLLVPDLRPVFNLMAPLLGKHHQKIFVKRFAAESLSFLVRKAAAGYHRDKTPLQLIIKHASDQLYELQETGKDYEFQQGLMSLFSDSIKGIQHGLHSSATAIMQEILLQTYDQDKTTPRHATLDPVLTGTIIAVLHHSNAESFEPLLDIILEQVKSQIADGQSSGLSARMLYTVCGVRKGTRVKNWPPVLEALNALLANFGKSSPDISDRQDFLAAATVVFQYCPLDVAIPRVKILESLSQGSWEPHFLHFSNLFADVGNEKFKTLLLPYFKKFISQRAESYGLEICTALPQLHQHDALPSNSIHPSSRWQDAVTSRFASLTNPGLSSEQSARLAHECSAYLDASQLLNLQIDAKRNIQDKLYVMLKRALDVVAPEEAEPAHVLATGAGFLYLAKDITRHKSLLDLWPKICQVASIYGHAIPYWQALLSLLEKNPESAIIPDACKVQFKEALMRCLGSPSHDLRLAVLGVLETIATDTEAQRTIIATANIIEQTPLNLDTGRAVSMRIRQLAKSYAEISSDEWAGEAIPTFLFGLLHVKFSQVWDDSCAALKEMCTTKEGEAHISRVAFEWLKDVEVQDITDLTPNSEQRPSRYATEFDCTNLMQLEPKIQQGSASKADLEERLTSMFETQHVKLPFITPFSRTQALRVLNDLPHVAEKRSRILVPILLKWVLDQPSEDSTSDDLTDKDGTEHPEKHWARKDQKAMLTLFSKFNNPRVLFKTNDVYEALLVLLSNGDVEIQKAALKAIMTWKDPAIVHYQENLFNLLDDVRFRNEISVFMDVSEEDSHLQEKHRDQVLPVILRLLYGKIISGKKGLDVKRRAVFVALTRFENDAIRQFLTIAFGRLGGLSIIKDGLLDEEVFAKELVSPRKQVGMLNMLEDLLGTLKTTLTPFVSSIVDPLLYCLIKATRGLTAEQVTPEPEDSNEQAHQASLFRTIRQRAFHSLYILLESCPEFIWSNYMQTIVTELIEPRLELFAIETAQSVSGLLRLFGAWAKSPLTASFFVDYNPDILPKVIDCLAVPSAKDGVKQFVLDDVLRRLVALVSDISDVSTDERIRKQRILTDVLRPHTNTILGQLGDLLKQSPSKEILESAVHTVAELAPHIAGTTEARGIIEIDTFLLRQPSKRVSAQTKLGLLKVLQEFIPRCDSKDLDELFDTLFDAICPLFSFVQNRESRTIACNILEALSEHREELRPVARLCQDLNAFSLSRLDEPDFDRRSSAFNTIHGDTGYAFSPLQWKPIVYNMLHFIKDNDELVIRDSASISLRRFIDASVQDETYLAFISSALFPGIQNGMREASELVRNEFLNVLAHLVIKYPDWAPITGLQVLLGPDEDSSFFGNVLNIQGHRRLRALRRLAASSSQLQSGNINNLLVPLLEHFIFNKAEDESAHNLSGESIKTISAMSEYLDWPQFRSLLRRFIGYLKSKEDMQKPVIKLLTGMLDSLNRAGIAKGYAIAKPGGSADQKEDENEEGNQIDGESAMDIDKPTSTLSKTLPRQEKLTADLTGNILPSLTEFLHNKDESTVSLRVPIAVAVTKVFLVLPPQELETRLPAVLLDICHILKSKSQDGRDMSRNTLSEIATLIGPRYLNFILKSLRTALQRGYQLHVLSYTLHHILVKLSPDLRPGDLDYCLPEIVDVIMDDIFGVTGQEKDAEDYISKAKEVKSSKSFDSMDIISRSATPTHLVELILPTKSLLCEKLNAKMVQKIDELIRRIGLGILQNPTVKDRDILVFCYELIQEVYRAKDPKKVKQEDPRNRRYLVNMKGAAKSGARGSASSYLYKITRFGLDILRTVFRKHDHLQTAQNVAGFLPIIGDALVQGQEEVQTAALRLLTTIMRTPLAALDKDCPIYVTEAVRIIKGAPSSNTELAQASLKMISSVLRERSSVEVKERDVALLLKRILPDLDEPDRQGVTFGFLKAVMYRKIVITEVYEVMDRVAAMMVTNQTRSARDLARSNYFHFLMEYPQAKNRFTKQVEFLIRNLRYDYVEGRQSVMEALNLILTKVGDDVLMDVLGTMFLPLIHAMANDESSDCRTMAGALVKKLFERADTSKLKTFTSELRGWLEQDEDTGLKRLSIQCWGLYFEVVEAKASEVESVLARLQSTVEECLERQQEDDWELIYYSLTVFSKLCKASPALTYSSEDLWAAIRSCVSYPHAWVKLTSAKLMGTFFAEIASTNRDRGLEALPLPGPQGLQLTETEMMQLTNAFLKNLSLPSASEEICTQSARNLFFLARCFAANGANWNWQSVEDNASDVEDENDMGMDMVEMDMNVDIATAPADNGVISTSNEPDSPSASDSDADEQDEFSGFSPPPKPKSKSKSPKSKSARNTAPLPPNGSAGQQDQKKSPHPPHGLQQPHPQRPTTALHRLLTRLSNLLRRETRLLTLPALVPKTSILTLLSTLTTNLPISSLTPSLPHLFTILTTLTDPLTTHPRAADPAFNEAYKGVIDKAREIVSGIQKRMESRDFMDVMGKVQKGVRDRREERKRKRRVDAVVRPEVEEKRRKRKHESSRVKRKERSAENRGLRRGW